MADNANWICKVRSNVETYMNKLDGYHDFNHIKRVVGLAHLIRSSITSPPTSETPTSTQKLDPTLITLGALLQDIEDSKYLEKGQDPTIRIRDLLLSFGANAELAEKVQTICLGVSWNSEKKDSIYDTHAGIEMMDLKLFELEETMETEDGKKMALEATARMNFFREWWAEEVDEEEIGAVVLEEAVKIEDSA
ncbi:uncharacterized protein RSE6_06247 [Rhynchosporium secalis]|uniref:HD domain-containing protein n=1 Tax=Rhynchosporium secalis TaxID=38038 RepID=A0A1E1M9V6_RHYSE|nr:uncharacterized protein RSE6_06247 [Rhynchosporium secalis]